MSNGRTIPTSAPSDKPTFTILLDDNELSREHHVLSIVVAKLVNKISYARIALLDGDPSTENFPVSNTELFVPGTQVNILAGITPIKSLPMAKYMATSVPGMDVPDHLIKRIKGVPKEKRTQEGIRICIEQIQQLREIPGVHGIHLMAIEWEHKVPAIMEQAGMLPRPVVPREPAPAPDAPAGEA